MTEPTKRCTACNTTKPITEFRADKRYRMGVSSQCRPCANEASYRWRRRNQETYNAVARQRKRDYDRRHPGLSTRQSATRRTINRKAVATYLEQHPCVDCDATNILILEFDHVRGTKSAGVAHLIQHSGLKRLFEEIAKCDVVCANCHRIRTITRAGHYRLGHLDQPVTEVSEP